MSETFLLGLDELEFLYNLLPEEGIILLRGDLAMGKTTLVKAIAKKLNIKEDITSPTFSIMQSYENRLFHYDIYQEKSKGFLRQGLHENLFKKGLHVVEWGDETLEKLLDKMCINYIIINILPSSENKRYYEVINAYFKS